MSTTGGTETISATFDLDGVEYQTVDIERLSIGELSIVKRMSGGLSQREIIEGLRNLDPDVWTALLFVSVRRVKLNVTVEEIQELELYPLVLSMAEEDEDEDPPASGVTSLETPQLSVDEEPESLETTETETDG